MMRLLLALAIFCTFSVQVMAQEPLVEITFDETKAIPGQPLTLRVTVLVPTWMPGPPVFPSFEAPNLLVQLPEGASGPTSRTIDGETWSGVSRRYLITPMVPGRFEVSGQSLMIKWAEPGQTDPLEQTVPLDPVVLEGVVPEGAEGLEPFLAAEALTLTRQIGDVTMPLSAGDSLSLTVTAEIEGASSMFLPQLLPTLMIEGVAVYPSEPVLQDRENRGKLSGSRTEEVTLVAESGGSGAFPEISVSWYNLSSGEVETATVEGFEIAVDAPKARAAPASPRVIGLYSVFGLILLGLGVLFWHLFAPRLRQWQSERRVRYEASEAWAVAAALKAVEARNMGALLSALDLWAARSSVDPRNDAQLASALSALGSARYGHVQATESDVWAAVRSALKAIGAIRHVRADANGYLPSLNPTRGDVRSYIGE